MYPVPRLCRDSEREAVRPSKGSWDDRIDNAGIGAPLTGTCSDTESRIAHLNEVTREVVAYDVVTVGAEVGRCWIACRAISGGTRRKGTIYESINRISRPPTLCEL